MAKLCPKVNLSVSIISDTVAIMICRQGGHPDATVSNFFDKPFPWFQSLSQDPFGFSFNSSTHKRNGLVMFGSPKAGADSRACFII